MNESRKRFCIDCKHYRWRPFEPVCGRVIEKGFTHIDLVTGERRVWPDTPSTCFKARLGDCDSSARFFRPKESNNDGHRWWQRLWAELANTGESDG